MLLIGIVAVAIVSYQWLSVDTIYYSEKPGTVVLPSGRRVSTNVWFKAGPEFPLTFLCTDTEGEFYLIEGTDSTSRIAMFESEGIEYNAIVEHYRVQGPNYRGEFWIRGERKDKAVTAEKHK